ncbi:MAG: class I SAM-dependent methyltransferase [Bacteroidetes bacterium]|nr:class I SAM-dependent methyltransferase [Bacteroidota bacterium]
MKHWFLMKQYLLYLMKANSAHGIHSPFVFDFITQILHDQRAYYAFDEIEKLRKNLHDDTAEIEVEDYGAGSHTHATSKRKIKDIAKNAGRNKKFGELLFRMVNHYQCKQILELGTSLGLGTAYIASANKNAKVITIEGSEQIARIATQNFSSLSLSNIQQIIGKFDEVLHDVLISNDTFDLIFVDGNHTKEATLRYFEQLLPYLGEHSILVFDDIHWSKGMHEAWEFIHQHQQVTLSIDVFFFGIVFFKKECMVKQHFILKY